jgi:hypothetical protein
VARNLASDWGRRRQHDMPVWAILLLVLASAAGIGLGGVLWYRRRERLLRETCEQMLAEYMPMDDTGHISVPLFRSTMELT